VDPAVTIADGGLGVGGIGLGNFRFERSQRNAFQIKLSEHLDIQPLLPILPSEEPKK